MPELVRDGVNGMLFGPGDAAGLADAIERMRRDDDLATATGAAARAAYERRYTPERNLSLLLRLYGDVVRGRRAA
jgi:glycosyltransferase involved in cell wall biosynthesis